MTKTGARSLLAAIPLALMLALTGCGADGGGSDDDVASADGSTPDGDGGVSNEPLSEDELHDKLLEYAQCLRDHGLDVDDPAPGERVSIQSEGDPKKIAAASKACEDNAPPPLDGGDLARDGGGHELMLDFAQCMRDQGVEKFKDPEQGVGIKIDPEIAEDPDFKAAEKTCDEEIAQAARDTAEG